MKTHIHNGGVTGSQFCDVPRVHVSFAINFIHDLWSKCAVCTKLAERSTDSHLQIHKDVISRALFWTLTTWINYLSSTAHISQSTEKKTLLCHDRLKRNNGITLHYLANLVCINCIANCNSPAHNGWRKLWLACSSRARDGERGHNSAGYQKRLFWMEQNIWESRATYVYPAKIQSEHRRLNPAKYNFL